MLEYLQNLNTLQIVALIGVGVLLFGYPYLKDIPAKLKNLVARPKNDSVEHTLECALGDVVHLRKHLTGDKEALEAIDKVLVPSLLRTLGVTDGLASKVNLGLAATFLCFLRRGDHHPPAF